MITAHVYPLDMRGDVETIRMHAEPAVIARAANHYLVRPNVEFLLANPRTPGILNSGVEYDSDYNEDWNPIPWVLHGKRGDCEDLASWGAAEDNVRRGIDSVVAVYRNNSLGMHCVLARPKRRYTDEFARWVIGETPAWLIVDLSRALGMGRKKRCSVSC